MNLMAEKVQFDTKFKEHGYSTITSLLKSLALYNSNKPMPSPRVSHFNSLKINIVGLTGKGGHL